ncbi:hypothetical protein B7463_g7883, partial [Scytalidium lignicola]
MDTKISRPLSANDRTESLLLGAREHFGGPRTSTELIFLELLKEAYPECKVVCTLASKCDLLGYSAAGYATAEIDLDQSIDITRSYKEPGARLKKEPGVLNNHVRFGKWKYIWQDFEFAVYEVEYTPDFRHPVRLFFLLEQSSPAANEEGVSTIDQLLLAAGAWSSELHEEIYVFDDAYWTKDRELWESVQGSSWDNVILNPEMKNNLMTDVNSFFDNQKLYKKLAVPWKRGLIFHGIPGNGKTLSIKAIINALQAREEPVPSLYVKSFDNCKGKKFSIREIFKKARIMAPCLLIFEDIDSLVEEKTRSYFLNEVDGLESNEGILMIGSTNHLNHLDPAISKRPSRFDRKYHFKLPNEDERAAYVRFWQSKLDGSDMVSFPDEVVDVVAKWTEGFSFAYLKELFVITLLTIARGGEVGDDTAAEDNAQSESGSSTDGTVVISNEDAQEAAKADKIDETKQQNPSLPAKDGEKIGEGAPATPTPPAKKRTVPVVPIPEHIQDNIILKIIHRQTKSLLEEMDNTKEDDWPSDKRRGIGFADPNMMLYEQMKRMASCD